MIYFDTSVLAAYYTPEERSAEAAAIVADASLPVVSDLAIAELHLAIVRKEHLGFLSRECVPSGFQFYLEPGGLFARSLRAGAASRCAS